MARATLSAAADEWFELRRHTQRGCVLDRARKGTVQLLKGRRNVGRKANAAVESAHVNLATELGVGSVNGVAG